MVKDIFVSVTFNTNSMPDMVHVSSNDETWTYVLKEKIPRQDAMPPPAPKTGAEP